MGQKARRKVNLTQLPKLPLDLHGLPRAAPLYRAKIGINRSLLTGVAAIPLG